MDHWSDQHRENSGEWAYGQARRIFLVEEDLSSETPLQDYKFFVFEGRVAMIYVTRASQKGSSLCFYSPGWQPFSATYNQRLIAPVSPAPARLSAMVEAASLLGHPFDFIRVDLYSVGEQAIFGELTPYPAGGLLRFDPSSFDLWLGQQWTLPPLS